MLMEKSWMNGGANHSKQTHTRKIPNYIKMEKQKNVKWLDGQTWFMHLFSFLVLLAQDPHPHKLNKKCMWTLKRLILLPNSYTNIVYSSKIHKAPPHKNQNK
jgi:hypothetical protein